MYQILDFIWKKEKEDFKPLLRLKVTDTISISDLELGSDLYKFSYKLSKEKYCIGFFDGKEWKKCINTYSNDYGLILKKPFEIQCFQCEKTQGFKSAFFFGEDPNEIMKKHLQQPHKIYIAYFYPNIIKVGTAASSREDIRLIEQDALIYAYIATSDGYNVQRLEKEISKKTNTTQTVRSSYKFKNLTLKPDPQFAQKLITNKINEIFSKFKGTEFEGWFFNRSNIIIQNIIDNPNIYYPESKVNLLEPKFFDKIEFIPLVGKYLGLRGRYLLLENTSEVFAIDTRFITGRLVHSIDKFS